MSIVYQDPAIQTIWQVSIVVTSTAVLKRQFARPLRSSRLCHRRDFRWAAPDRLAARFVVRVYRFLTAVIWTSRIVRADVYVIE